MSIRFECDKCQQKYRLSAASEQRSIRCRKCGNEIAIAASPRTRQPGSSGQTIRHLACPACTTAELHERRLKNGLQVDVCPSCRGTRLDGGELLKLTQHDEAARQAVSALKWDSKESQRSCPRCNQCMLEGSFLDDVTHVEWCEECDGLWFDAAELKGTLEFLKTPAVDDKSRHKRLPVSEEAVRLASMSDRMSKQKQAGTKRHKGRIPRNRRKVRTRRHERSNDNYHTKKSDIVFLSVVGFGSLCMVVSITMMSLRDPRFVIPQWMLFGTGLLLLITCHTIGEYMRFKCPDCWRGRLKAIADPIRGTEFMRVDEHSRGTVTYGEYHNLKRKKTVSQFYDCDRCGHREWIEH